MNSSAIRPRMDREAPERLHCSNQLLLGHDQIRAIQIEERLAPMNMHPVLVGIKFLDPAADLGADIEKPAFRRLRGHRLFAGIS